MGVFDDITKQASDLADKVKDLADDHPDQVEGALDRIGDVINDKTGGKFADQIDKAEDTVLDKLKADDKA